MSTSSLQWVVSAYVLGYGGFLLLGGRAADLLGRRRVFLIALGVFVVASMLGGLANDGTLLIATRFVKGVSAAFTAPAALSIITTSFAEGPARNKALAVFTATGATGSRSGSCSAALLTEIGWRWVFFLPAPVALVVAARRAPARAARPRRRPASRGRSTSSGAVSHDVGDAAARLHARRGAERSASCRLGRSARSPRSPRSSPRSSGGSGARPRRSCGSGSSARATSCGRTSARWRSSAAGSASSSSPRSTCRAARLVAARDRARDLPGRRARGAALAGDPAADRRGSATTRLIVAGLALGGCRLRAVPADRARLELRSSTCCRRSCSPASASRSRSGR